MEAGGGGDNGESSRANSSFMQKGDRQLFKVELRPGETTIVSWKKLVKDANKVNGSSGSGSGQPDKKPPAAAAGPILSLESRLAPGQPAEIDKKDAHRFSAVIERIERLYTGNNSSDGEDLDNVPDDDEYDTEDSFIDDTELDEYFEVDKSTIKHDGFFVNRGSLERIEPLVQPGQQQKKRRRKDLGKTQDENTNGRVSNKHMKVGKTASGNTTMLAEKNLHTPSQSRAVAVRHSKDASTQDQLGSSQTAAKKKSLDTKMIMDPYSSNKAPVAGSLSLLGSKAFDKQKTGSPRIKNPGHKLKAIAGASDASHQKYGEKSASGKPLSSFNEEELPTRSGEKNGSSERPDAGPKYPRQMKNQQIQKRDASAARPKGSMLEKAIRELEKMVAESRPPTMDNQDADASSQAVKRRLPREIKQRLAKVARLAQATHGKISKELLNRLMSILGHLIQLRTLKRNLQVMINMGLSAKQEKDAKFLNKKQELAEMIKAQVPLQESKVLEPKAGESDDFQDVGTEDKGAKRNFTMDAALEDKICDLYDLFVDGLDEDAGPQVRKLYAELAKLWPNGLMDNNGIKQAISKAKERKRAVHGKHKDQEKIKRKKMLATKVEAGVRAEAAAVVQPQHMRDKLATENVDSGSYSVSGDRSVVLAIQCRKSMSGTTCAVGTSSSSMDAASLDKPKQEISKFGPSNALDDARVSDDNLLKKKVKRKPETELDRSHVRPEKLSTPMGEERHKSQKQTTVVPQKISPQPAAPSFE